MRARFLLMIICSFPAGALWAVDARTLSARYELVGVIASTMPRKNGVAVLKDTTTGKTATVQVGQVIPQSGGIVLETVEQRHVTIKASDRTRARLSYTGGSVASDKSVSSPISSATFDDEEDVEDDFMPPPYVPPPPTSVTPDGLPPPIASRGRPYSGPYNGGHSPNAVEVPAPPPTSGGSDNFQDEWLQRISPPANESPVLESPDED